MERSKISDRLRQGICKPHIFKRRSRIITDFTQRGGCKFSQKRFQSFSYRQHDSKKDCCQNRSVNKDHNSCTRHSRTEQCNRIDRHSNSDTKKQLPQACFDNGKQERCIKHYKKQRKRLKLNRKHKEQLRLLDRYYNQKFKLLDRYADQKFKQLQRRRI